MNIHLTLNVILLLAGILVGIITTAALCIEKANRQANKFLAALVMVCVGSLMHNLFVDAGVYQQKPALYFLPVLLPLGIGPLLYLYINRLVFLRPLHWRNVLLHLVPMLMQFLFFLVCFLQNPQTKNSIYTKIYAPFVSPLQTLAVYISVSFYIYFSFKEIAHYKLRLASFYSNTHQIALDWLYRLLFIFMAYYALAIFFALISYSFNTATNYFPSDFIRCIIIFIIAAFALRQNNLIDTQKHLLSVDQNIEADIPAEPNLNVQQNVLQAGLIETPVLQPVKPKEINAEILQQIVTLVEDKKLYLDEELTIATIALQLGYSTKTISHTINNGLGKSFSLFINEYRVQLFQSKRASGNFSHLSIMGLAYDCGFNSKSTFNRIYKEITGSLPKEQPGLT